MAKDPVPREQTIRVEDLVIGDLLRVDWRCGTWNFVEEISRVSPTLTVVRLKRGDVMRIANLDGPTCRVLR